MASWSERLELTDEEIADLTDGELVEYHHFVGAEIGRLRQLPLELVEWAEEGLSAEQFEHLLGAPPESTDDYVRYSRCRELAMRIESEKGLRLGEMLRRARLALGLTHRDVGRVAGIHSKFVNETEQGRRIAAPGGLFERACTEGGIASIEEHFRRSVWFPLTAHRFCQTIRPATVDPAWLAGNDGAVPALARSIREGRAFHLLPILGDALEEAGCVDPAILDHCRTPGEHARGCWVVDALVRAGRRG
jgi:transcriptional regulator with XRE-family HTH domain